MAYCTGRRRWRPRRAERLRYCRGLLRASPGRRRSASRPFPAADRRGRCCRRLDHHPHEPVAANRHNRLIDGITLRDAAEVQPHLRPEQLDGVPLGVETEELWPTASGPRQAIRPREVRACAARCARGGPAGPTVTSNAPSTARNLLRTDQHAPEIVAHGGRLPLRRSVRKVGGVRFAGRSRFINGVQFVEAAKAAPRGRARRCIVRCIQYMRIGTAISACVNSNRPIAGPQTPGPANPATKSHTPTLPIVVKSFRDGPSTIEDIQDSASIVRNVSMINVFYHGRACNGVCCLLAVLSLGAIVGRVLAAVSSPVSDPSLDVAVKWLPQPPPAIRLPRRKTKRA